jgi:hypothetical protein
LESVGSHKNEELRSQARRNMGCMPTFRGSDRGGLWIFGINLRVLVFRVLVLGLWFVCIGLVFHEVAFYFYRWKPQSPHAMTAPSTDNFAV